jgi:hypothetical protein
MVGLLLLFLAKSRYGKAIRAVGSNAEMARNVGLNIDRLYLLVFGIGSSHFHPNILRLAGLRVSIKKYGNYSKILPQFWESPISDEWKMNGVNYKNHYLAYRPVIQLSEYTRLMTILNKKPNSSE